jgi:hypothetical protein
MSGGRALVGSAGELHGSFLWLGVKEDRAKKVSRWLSMARVAEAASVATVLEHRRMERGEVAASNRGIGFKIRTVCHLLSM